jgi:predicted amidohydrolase
VRLATLAWKVERHASLAGYAARLDALVAEAAPRADLLLMPEYASMELAPTLAAEPGEAAELVAMVDAYEEVLAAMRAAAVKHRVWLQPGTLPMRSGDIIINRAPLIRPDGCLAFQDKWQMTRFENERWGVSRGASPQVFDTPWGLIGISICYDSEFPKHVRTQVEAGAWLVLVPTCTDSLAGFTRVAISARARAIENQCILAVAPTVGSAPWSSALDENVGAAGVYGPADRGFPDDGIIAESALNAPGWVYAEIDQAMVEKVRREGAVLNHRDWPRAPIEPVTRAAFS